MSCYDDDCCVDCNVNCLEINEYYMVTDSCWKRSGMEKYGGMLCIGCLEQRLGKKLTPRNFKECPLNWRHVLIPGYSSTRILSRMLSGKKSKWHVGAIECYEAMLSGDENPYRTLTLT